MNITFSLLLTWLFFIPIAFANGAIREILYKPYVGLLFAHQISTLTATIAFLLLTYFMLGSKTENLSSAQLLSIGFLWVLMTITFEFGFGHYINHTPWSTLLLDYNILKGHVWGLFLLVVFASPFLVKLIHNRF